jgi:hypothetical protein
MANTNASEHPTVVAMWQRTDALGLEYCTLATRPDGATLSGTVLAAPDDVPMRLVYAVRCDDAWRTTTAAIDLHHAGVHTRVELACDDTLRWYLGGEHLPELDGCEDVDLSATPSTNTLPIRRLALEVGASRDVLAAWIRFPSCEIAPLPQRYTRLGDRRFRYESRGGAFVAELEVDAHGLVIDYPPAWSRVRR